MNDESQPTQPAEQPQEPPPQPADTGQVFVILGFIFAAIGLLFCPILFGGAAIVMGILAKNKGNALGIWVIAAGIVSLILGIIIGAIIGMMSMRSFPWSR
jgi:MFS family permease